MSSNLRPALLFNAGFSAASGVLFLVAPTTVAGWLGVDLDGWIQVAGLALLGHGLLLGALMTRVDVRGLARLNLAAIAPYPLLMIALVVTGLIDRPLGRGLALADGAAIAAIAVALATGLRPSGLQNHDEARQAQHA